MTDLLRLDPDDKVLEIGTGSGYQTAVLSRLCHTVYSMEVVSELVDDALIRLENLGFQNVHLQAGNGYLGWPEYSPYDAIIVTAAAPYVPDSLIEQLKPGGRMVIPVGKQFMRQELICIEKDVDGTVHEQSVLGVVFVPLIDKAAN